MLYYAYWQVSIQHTAVHDLHRFVDLGARRDGWARVPATAWWRGAS